MSGPLLVFRNATPRTRSRLTPGFERAIVADLFLVSRLMDVIDQRPSARGAIEDLIDVLSRDNGPDGRKGA